MHYRLDVAIPALSGNGKPVDVFKVQAMVERVVGSLSDDSGMGFGLRDLGFIFKVKAKAEEAADRIEKARIPDIDWRVSTRED
jgi:hypothetical protein